MSLKCGEIRDNRLKTSFDKVKAFIIIVCPVGHPMISTLCLWEREICNFSRWKEKVYMITTKTLYRVPDIFENFEKLDDISQMMNK